MTVLETTGLGNNWRLYAYAVAFNQALIDTGDQSGPLPTTRLVSTLGSWSVNQPVHFYVALTTGIRAADQSPNARSEAVVAFPFDMPVFSFFDANGIPVEGFSAHSAGFTCPRGDMDCDQTVTPLDIPAFASALLSPVSVGFCESTNPDMNADGSIDGRDIEPFIVCVLGGGCRDRRRTIPPGLPSLSGRMDSCDEDSTQLSLYATPLGPSARRTWFAGFGRSSPGFRPDPGP